MKTRLQLFWLTTFLAFVHFQIFADSKNERIPFYEDFIESGELEKYLRIARDFLDEKPDAAEAPRIALDLLMMGKAAENIEAVALGTDLLLFDYLGSLPSLHFLSTFDRGSKRLSELLKVKCLEADLSDSNFSQSFANTISLLARLQGPQLLDDSDLRIRAYLLTKNSDNSSLNQSIGKALQQLINDKDKLSPVAEIILSERSPEEKVRQLSKMSNPAANFSSQYYFAQLDDGNNTQKEITELKIELKLFSNQSDPKTAIEQIELLPKNLRNSPKYKTYIAYALLLNEQNDEALNELSNLLENHENLPEPWKKTAKSFSDGVKFSESRKNLLIDQIGLTYDRLSEPKDALFAKATYTREANGTQKTLEIELGACASTKTFEIQVKDKDTPVFFYRTDQNISSLLNQESKLYQFKTSGAFPLPIFDISRDNETGIFNYSFNLNFARTYNEFIEGSRKILDNSYIGSSKGREVLLGHILKSKGFWIAPPVSLENGTEFVLHSLRPTGNPLSESRLTIDLSGDFSVFSMGNFKLHHIERGGSKILDNLSNWPNPKEKQLNENFELPLLLQAIGDLLAP